MSRSLRRRIERVEAALGVDDVKLDEVLFWTIYAPRPFDAETQRGYDDFLRRYELSRPYRLMEERDPPLT
jgi:hypothetical protein